MEQAAAKLMTEVIDLHPMPDGPRYEDRYGHYLRIFHDIAHKSPDITVVVRNAPTSWVPLLHYLGCFIQHPRLVFPHDKYCLTYLEGYGGNTAPPSALPDRTFLEVMCGFRPETTDALWKIDCQSDWQTPRTHAAANSFHRQSEFIVTTNGAFHRPEVQDFGLALSRYKPNKKKVILLPCAADKPYPSTLHRVVRHIVDDEWYLANATGVLGIVPDDLWGVMPHYDSGMPHEWRLMNIAREYFTQHAHDQIVCYTDYYNVALWEAFAGISNGLKNTKFINPVHFYPDYLDLLDPQRLTRLYSAVYPDASDALPLDTPFADISADCVPIKVRDALSRVNVCLTTPESM